MVQAHWRKVEKGFVKQRHWALSVNMSEPGGTQSHSTSTVKWISYSQMDSKGLQKLCLHCKPVPKAQESCPEQVESHLCVPHLHHS